jgi:hypothetical protein
MTNQLRKQERQFCTFSGMRLAQYRRMCDQHSANWVLKYHRTRRQGASAPCASIGRRLFVLPVDSLTLGGVTDGIRHSGSMLGSCSV